MMMTKLKGPKLATAIVIIAVACIPLLYAGLFTMTYQNPTNRVDHMTAAVVNEDKPFTGQLISGNTETFSLGKELTDELVNPKPGEEVGFTWKTMDADEARAKMNSEDIRAILYIPRDFSKNVAKIGTDVGSSATQELRLVTDDGVNYLAGTMAKTVSEKMTNRINQRGANKVTDRLLMSIEKARSGISKAADGSSKLADGTKKLTDGVGKFDDGLGKLSNGSQELSAGSGRLVVGMNDLVSGSVTLNNGLAKLGDGATAASNGSRKLVAGLGKLSNGAEKAADGSHKLNAGMAELATGADTLQASTRELGPGVKALADGSERLTGGLYNYTNGVDEAQAGSAKLQAAAQALPAGLAKMQAGVGQPGDYDPQVPKSEEKSLTAGVEALDAGVKRLHAGLTESQGKDPSLQKGAAGLANFTSLIVSSLDTMDFKHGAELNTNAKNFTASVDSYTQEVDQLAQACAPADSPTCQQLAALAAKSEGLRTSGAGVAGDVAKASLTIRQMPSLVSMMHSVSDGLEKIHVGVDQVVAGSDLLQAGVTKLGDGVTEARAGVAKMQEKVGSADSTDEEKLMGGVNKLANGLSQIAGKDNANSVALRAGATKVMNGSFRMRDNVPALLDGINRIDTGSNTLATKVGDLSTGLDKLANGANTAASSAGKLSGGLEKLGAGIGKAANGSQRLHDGLAQANDGAAALNSGAKKLANGAATAKGRVGELASGAKKLNDGADKLRDGLVAGEKKIPELSQADQKNISNTAGAIAEVKSVREHAVVNNGAGFTPMFMSLALWIGTIALFLVLPALDYDERARGRWAQAVAKPAVTATIFAIVQAVVMMVVVDLTAELQAANLFGLCALAALTSICFMAINQACVAAFAFRGRFLSIVLLSLQITSMGATFPIETAPRFFQWIHWFLPMSDTQLAFRSLIAGGGVPGIIGKTVVVLLMWTVIAVIISLVAAKVRISRKKPVVHDEALAPTAQPS